MDRLSEVIIKDLPYNVDETYFRYVLPEYNKLIQRVYKNRNNAYKAIDKFIEIWKKDTIKNNRYFKDKFILEEDNFIVIEPPKYKIEGFETEEDYLDYKAYCN